MLKPVSASSPSCTQSEAAAASPPTGRLPATPGAPPAPSSRPAPPVSAMAIQATAKLFRLLPPLDVSGPKEFIAATAAIFARYPAEVVALAIDPVRGIPGRIDRPTLAAIKRICDELYEPYERAAENARARESAQRLRLMFPPRPPRSVEEQAAVDRQVAAARRTLGIPPAGLPPRGVQPRLVAGDGRHHQRIAADLAARRARKEVEDG